MKNDLTTEISQRSGFRIIQNAVPNSMVARLKDRLLVAIEEEKKYHGSINYQDFGMVLVCPKYDRIFCEVFDQDTIFNSCNELLGEGSIVYAYTSSSMPPKGKNYSSRIHVDCPRVIPGYLSQIGIIIALDDFTKENGGTFFLPGSQDRKDAPSEEEFFRNAIQIEMPAGSVCVFHAHLWHYGATNKTDLWRHAITINMCRSYMKQRFDFPRMLDAAGISNISLRAKQKLGYLSQIPATYDEYYAPPEKRKWQQVRD